MTFCKIVWKIINFHSFLMMSFMMGCLKSNIYTHYCQKERFNSKRKSINDREIQTYIGLLIYLGLIDAMEIRHYTLLYAQL
jgi:hypothetical protein